MATKRESAVSDAASEKDVLQLFRERMKRLPRILRVEEHEDGSTGLPSFRIFVGEGDRETQYAIYELEADLYRRYPGAFLDVQVLVEAAGARSDSQPQANGR